MSEFATKGTGHQHRLACGCVILIGSYCPVEMRWCPAHASTTALMETLKAVAGWASDEGPLKGKSPGDISDFARAALARAEAGSR